MRIILRIIGGIIGLVTLGGFIWDCLATQEISKYSLINLPTGIALLLYAVGGRTLLNKLFPYLVKDTFSWPGRKKDRSSSKK